MNDNYFQRYSEFISELQNRLFRIQLRYEETQHFLYTDYMNGEISKEVFELVYQARMDTYIDCVDSKYVLTLEEVNFVKEYGHLDEKGQLLKTILKKEYLDKESKLKLILDSVVKFAYYDSFDSVIKRLKFKDDIISTFSKQKKVSMEKIARMKNTLVNYESLDTYKEEVGRLKNANKALEFALHIPSFDDEYLNKLIAAYYGIKYEYYEWYKKMAFKELCDKGIIYTDHLNSVNELNITLDECSAKKKTVGDLEKNLERYTGLLVEFLEEITDFDYEEFEERKDKRGFFKRNNQLDNKDILFDIFKNLVMYSSTFDYIINNLVSNKEESGYDVNEVFTRYFKLTYGEDTKYVDIYTFVRDFRNKVIAYFKSVIKKYKEEYKKVTGEINSISDSVISKSHDLLDEASLIKDISLGYTSKNDIFLPGFTLNELESIYFSLKSYIIDSTINERELGGTNLKV